MGRIVNFGTNGLLVKHWLGSYKQPGKVVFTESQFDRWLALNETPADHSASLKKHWHYERAEMNLFTATLFLASWCLFKSVALQNRNTLPHLLGYTVIKT